MDQLERDIEILAQSIWEAMFADHQGLSELGTGGDLGTGPFVTSYVAINGAWEGAVIARFPEALAAQLTDALFGSDRSSGPDEVRDAIGELGNILAGNIKALVPEPSAISLPAVAFGNDYDVSVASARLVAGATFTGAGEVFSVAVLESVENEVSLP